MPGASIPQDQTVSHQGSPIRTQVASIPHGASDAIFGNNGQLPKETASLRSGWIASDTLEEKRKALRLALRLKIPRPVATGSLRKGRNCSTLKSPLKTTLN